MSRDIPAHVQQHQLAFVTSSEEAECWRRAWIEVRALAHEWDPLTHLSMYLAKSKRRHRAVSPDDWVAWFTEDEQKARAEARERATQQNGYDSYEEQIAATVRHWNRERREQEAREAQR